MIHFFLLLSILTVAFLPFRSKIFELVAATLLVIPIQAFLLGHLVTLSAVTYGALLLLNVGVVYLALSPSDDKFSIWDIAPMILWGFLFVVCLSLCYRWADFMPMGERIRDYALLAEVMKNPIYPHEPWMTGFQLNYYLYWYRFGSFLGSFLHFPAWQMYHVLQAVTFSLFITACFRILHRIAGLSMIYALFGALIIGFGSNVEGVQYAFSGVHDAFKWWGPSRVIAGCINEFAAWSFLLGDLHPHYLNLPLVPMFLVWIHSLWDSELPREKSTIVAAALAILLFPLWIFNGNAWEVPELGLLVGFFAILLLYLNRSRLHALKQDILDLQEHVRPLLPALAIILVGAVSLYLSSRNISPGGDHFNLVKDPVKRTATGELFRHWGVPLSVVSISTALLLKNSNLQVLAISALAGSTHAATALPFIVFLILFNLIRLLRTEKEAFSFNRILMEMLGLTSLSLLVLPELFFLNDPYGGDSERMNTIFKAYSANWSLFHLFAVWLLIEAIKHFSLPAIAQHAAVTAILLPGFYIMGSFFFITVGDRSSNSYSLRPIEQGLNQLENTYAGAAEAIKRFQEMPEGVTLESQGNPYSLTSHVATLGGKRSYLGWINHVDLLLRNYEESKRRASITDAVYKSVDCPFIKDTLTQEGITYLVVGPLEKERYKDLRLDSFSCLQSVVTTQSYAIFKRS